MDKPSQLAFPVTFTATTSGNESRVTTTL